MSFTLDDIDFLTSEIGQHCLTQYAKADVSDSNTLQVITELRKSLTLDQASAILTTVRLRQKARDKFPQYADQILLTESALQQASDPHIRRYRAQLIDPKSVLDVCCSIGSDALTFSQYGHQVTGLDFDAVRIAMARHNASVMGVEAQFECRDVQQGVAGDYELIFYDPARRTSDGKRIVNVEHYIPPLSLVRNIDADEIAVKLSPAVNLSQLVSYGGQVEFISVDGDLKEAVLWLQRETSLPQATLLADNNTYHFISQADVIVDVTHPKHWLFEPDPAILRAGLVQDLASTLNGTMLDESIAYLTMDKRTETPWGRYWQILDWMPFHLKKLRAYLRDHNVTHLTVKKRGFPMSPDEIIAKLKLKHGHESRVLVMTRFQGNPIVIVCANL